MILFRSAGTKLVVSLCTGVIAISSRTPSGGWRGRLEGTGQAEIFTVSLADPGFAQLSLRLCWNLPKIHDRRQGKRSSFTLFQLNIAGLCALARCSDVTMSKTWSWTCGASSLA